MKCPPAALRWEKRRLYILLEILKEDPDILCMQEVDHFDYFKLALSKVGYDGIFKSKLDSPCLYVTPSYGPDGCALFYKTAKLD